MSRRGRAGGGGERNGYLATSEQVAIVVSPNVEMKQRLRTFNVQALINGRRDWIMGLGQEGPRIARPDIFPSVSFQMITTLTPR